MTSGSKKKADLVALFKLEFYRKQNNWKFCSQVQKSKKAASAEKATCKAKVVKSKQVERCLNKTYNVETGKDGEKSVLNEAFLETDDDKISSPQVSPQTPSKDWSPKIIRITDKWSPPACASLNDTINIHPHTETPESTGDNPDLNLTATADSIYQIWPQEGIQKQRCLHEDYNWEPFWPYMTQNKNDLDVKYQTAPEKFYNDNSIQEKKLHPNWLQPEIKYKGPVINYRNCSNITNEQTCPENIEKSPQNKSSKVMQNRANIPMTLNNGKQSEINNNLKQYTDWTKNITPETIYRNVHNLKETRASSDTQNLQHNWPGQIWQNEAQWQGDEFMELPELDKVGQEGTEAEWQWETQIRTNNQLFPEVIWSEEVLRELELLNMNELSPDEPPEGEKWVPPDRLLQWMLANKECCDSVLESSCESLEEFMRAAHCAPHSSEIDLQPQLEALEASIEAFEAVGGAEAGAWSWAALRAAGRGHARALHRVTRELRARERLVGNRDLGSRSVHPLISCDDVSCEEYPTRDIGLHQPAFTDAFISGSYKNNLHNKLLEKSKELDDKNMGFNENEGPIHLQGGQIVVKANNGQSNFSSGQTERYSGQTERYSGQRGRNGQLQNWGEMEPNKNQIFWGQTEPKRCRTANLKVLGDQIVIDQYETSPDQSQLDNCQGGFGDHEIVGRGRGRLVGWGRGKLVGWGDNRTGGGRGRGRL